MKLALARLDSSRFPRLGLLEGEAADSVKTTFFTFLASPLTPLTPRLEVGEEEAEESRDVDS